MSNHNAIVLKSCGHQVEGKLATGQTPKPGQGISLKSDGTYEGWNGTADGERDEVIILEEFVHLGMMKTDAYPNGGQFIARIPCPGDELQVLVQSGETILVGDKLIIKDGTGKFIKTTGTPESEPFKALEASGGALAADTHILVRATGS